MGSEEETAVWRRPFGDEYRILDLDSRPETEAAREVRLIERTLGLRRGDEVLDIACATGRHSVRLALNGYRVTALDLNKDYLALAGARAADAGVEIRTVAEDMRRLPRLGAGTFDAAVIMYSSFGYFPDRRDNASVLRGVREILKRRGRLLLDVINRDWFVRNYYPSDYVQRDALFVTRDFQDVAGKIFLHENVFRPLESTLSWSVSAAGDPDPLFTVTYRMYSVHEIVDLLEEAGLCVDRLIGGYDGKPFSLLSERIICAASRR